MRTEASFAAGDVMQPHCNRRAALIFHCRIAMAHDNLRNPSPLVSCYSPQKHEPAKPDGARRPHFNDEFPAMLRSPLVPRR
jgi:hypothetical protein